MSEQPSARPAHGHWFFHPYLQLCLNILIATTSELLLSHGAKATKALADSSGLFGLSALASGWTWLGIIAYIMAFVCWLQVLRFLPLNIAFALISFDQVLIPLGSWYFLGETIGMQRWCGIVMVLAGITVIAKPLMQAEERL